MEALSLCQEVARMRTYEDLFMLIRNMAPPIPPAQIQLNVLILNAPCNGFGDLVFAWKLAKLLRYLYPKCTIKIATTQPEKMMTLGEERQHLYRLATTFEATAHTQCRKYTRLHMFTLDGRGEQVDTSVFDMFLDAPVTTDNEPDLAAIHRLVPTATRFNTFSFSEYNDTLRKDFDFHTGVGEGRDGLLFLPPQLGADAMPSQDEIMALVKPDVYAPQYALMYVNDSYAVSVFKPCAHSFLRMITAKYGRKQRMHTFQVLMNPTLIENADLTNPRVCARLFGEAFDRVMFVTREGTLTVDVAPDLDDDSDPATLFVRGDVLPVANRTMIGLMRYSVKDILITGDQSLTDVLNWCPSKNVFYQIMPWKENLGRELAKLLPNPFFKSRKTSCGGLDALRYNSNYKRFIQTQALYVRAKDKLASLFTQAYLARHSPLVRAYMDAVLRGRTVKGVLARLCDQYGVREVQEKEKQKQRKTRSRSRSRSRRSRKRQ